MAAAQLAGEDFLVGLDRQRADAAGKVLAPVAGLCSTTAAGLARRFTDGQWHAVETGIGDIGAAMLTALPAQRAAALCAQVTIDLDTTDVEVYGRHKRAVAYNYQGQRCGRPHVATWAETATVLAADLMAGNEDPRPHAGALLNRALAALPVQARAGRILLRADAGYFAGQLARAALFADVEFAAIGAKRVAPLWRILSGVREDDWTDAIDMDAAQVAVAEYCPDWWPATTRLLIRRVALAPGPGQRRPAVAAPPHSAPRAAGAADRRPRRRRRDLRLLVRRDQPRCVHTADGRLRSSTGAGTGPRWRTCSATPSTVAVPPRRDRRRTPWRRAVRATATRSLRRAVRQRRHEFIHQRLAQRIAPGRIVEDHDPDRASDLGERVGHGDSPLPVRGDGLEADVRSAAPRSSRIG